MDSEGPIMINNASDVLKENEAVNAATNTTAKIEKEEEERNEKMMVMNEYNDNNINGYRSIKLVSEMIIAVAFSVLLGFQSTAHQ